MEGVEGIYHRGSRWIRKWALEALVECYRTELSGFGIEFCIVESGAMPTTFFDGLVLPNDPERAEEHGEFANVPALGRAGLSQMLESVPEQRPERVAEAVATILEMSFGEKPFRSLVDYMGVGPQIERYNEVLEDVTRTLLTNFGIAETLELNA